MGHGGHHTVSRRAIQLEFPSAVVLGVRELLNSDIYSVLLELVDTLAFVSGVQIVCRKHTSLTNNRNDILFFISHASVT